MTPTSEQWADVKASVYEVRREIGRAYTERPASPWPRLAVADRRLVRLAEYARMRAAEAEGIGYVAPGQLPMALDGCYDGMAIG